MTDAHKLTRITLLTSILLFTSSLFFPAYYDVINEFNYGALLLIFGILTIFEGGFGLLWLANIFILYGWIKIKNEKRSFIASGIATFICLQFFFIKKIPNYAGWCGSFLEPMPCGKIEIVSIEAGYYLWLLSAVTLLIGNFLRYLDSR